MLHRHPITVHAACLWDATVLYCHLSKAHSVSCFRTVAVQCNVTFFGAACELQLGVNLGGTVIWVCTQHAKPAVNAAMQTYITYNQDYFVPHKVLMLAVVYCR